MTGKGLRINFKQALKMVKKMEVLSELLNEAATEDISYIMVGMAENWEGEAADSYSKKLKILYDQMCQTAVSIYSAAVAAENQVRQIYEAEQKAIMTIYDTKFK